MCFASGDIRHSSRQTAFGRPSEGRLKPATAGAMMQIAGFILQDSVIVAIRWVPTNTLLLKETEQLCYHVPPASVPLIKPRVAKSIQERLPVKLYVLNHPKHYDAGEYRIEQWISLDSGDVYVELRRAIVPPQPPPLILVTPSLKTVRDCMQQWNVDHITETVQFPMPQDGPFVPSLMVFGILDQAVVEWCGPSNRLGHNCLIHETDGYPSKGDVLRARAAAIHYRFPIMIAFVSSAREDSVVQCILFHPHTGETCRAHFEHNTKGQISLMHGEFGDT